METSPEILKHKARNIRYFFCDVDGTLTDGTVYYSPDGELLKCFSLRDGTGFFLLRQCGIKTGIITTEESQIVAQRAKKLAVDTYIYGSQNKTESIREFLFDKDLSFKNIAYIGDEINDLKLIRQCGLSFAVADADHRVIDAADVVCDHKGGNGAFREAVESLLTLLDVNISNIIEKKL